MSHKACWGLESLCTVIAPEPLECPKEGSFTLMRRWLPFIVVLMVGCKAALPKEDYDIVITSHICDADGGDCHKETKVLPFTESTR